MRALHLPSLVFACSVAALAIAPARAEPAPGPQAHIERMCADQNFAERLAKGQARRAEHLTEALKLTDAQKAALKDLQTVEAKNRADGRAALCAAKPDLSSFEKRLAFRQASLQRRLDGLKAADPKLIAFYQSLDAAQKTKFEDILRERGHHGWKKSGPGPHKGPGPDGPDGPDGASDEN